MNPVKEDILACLKGLKGSGRFVSMKTMDFIFPGLEVAGVGEIAYPVTNDQAKVLIQAAHKAPFGKGSKTIVDNKIRSGWEINPDKLSFRNDMWPRFIQKVINNLKPDLGLEDYKISASLYKMLIYEKGDFFLPHQDSEKEKGMFGTLVIGLPSGYSGGELIVRFGGTEETADFAAEAGNYKINYTAFYADCEHEVKPLTSGHRICLVYNLIQEKSGKKIQFNAIEAYAEKLAAIFKKRQKAREQKPDIILLGHQYTPENFSIDALKLNDRSKAQALVNAAGMANCYAKMCLVTSYLTGAPEYDRYGYDDDDPEAEMAEVFDQSLYIEYWSGGEIPPLDHVRFEQDDLITAFELDEDEPIVKESTGYMGNWGPDLMHWYHYGAVMVWSHDANAQLLPEQDTESQLAWIDYFNKNPEQLHDSESAAIELILSSGLTEARNRKVSYDGIADWIIQRKDQKFFLRLNDELRELYFIKIGPGHWLKLVEFFPDDITSKILDLVTKSMSLPVVTQILSILHVLIMNKKKPALVETQIRKLPDYFSALLESPAKADCPPSGAVVNDLLKIEEKKPQDEAWESALTKILMSWQKRDYINHVLVPQLLEGSATTRFSGKLLSSCRQYLQAKADNQPLPPANWTREMPKTTLHKKQWQELKHFLASPNEWVFDYRKIQRERNEMEYAIREAEVDLKTETIKKGSPHTLRITKTQASYEKEMKEWKEDVKLLEKIIMKKGNRFS